MSDELKQRIEELERQNAELNDQAAKLAADLADRDKQLRDFKGPGVEGKKGVVTIDDVLTGKTPAAAEKKGKKGGRKRK